MERATDICERRPAPLRSGRCANAPRLNSRDIGQGERNRDHGRMRLLVEMLRCRVSADHIHEGGDDPAVQEPVAIEMLRAKVQRHLAIARRQIDLCSVANHLLTPRIINEPDLRVRLPRGQ